VALWCSQFSFVPFPNLPILFEILIRFTHLEVFWKLSFILYDRIYIRVFEKNELDVQDYYFERILYPNILFQMIIKFLYLNIHWNLGQVLSIFLICMKIKIERFDENHLDQKVDDFHLHRNKRKLELIVKWFHRLSFSFSYKFNR
jgi:hypothetical protein